jgi:hypothetical protein
MGARHGLAISRKNRHRPGCQKPNDRAGKNLGIHGCGNTTNDALSRQQFHPSSARWAREVIFNSLILNVIFNFCLVLGSSIKNRKYLSITKL